MARVFIGLGSNQGDRFQYLSRVMQSLGREPGVRIVAMATIIETEPVGGPPQGPYLNTVAELESTLSPAELLGVLKRIEQQHGRQPSAQRWVARPIDLDILLYDAQIIDSPALTIPHPRLHERRFVLEPLVQLVPELVHPVLQRSMAALLAQLPAAQSVP